MTEVLDNLHPALRDLTGKTIVGRYRVDALLGLGGMGAVFRGRHLGLERDVAIKVLHPDLTRDPEISKRFDREAHSASRLDHPNCLRVTDVGSSEDGLKFMVMDLLAGSELSELVGERLPPDRAVLLVLQILRGLEHAHEHGVIHRDIKPENVFVTRDHDGREVLKLVDFGIAKLVGGGADDRMTKAGLIFGTPAYMSPEQAMGMEADHRADLYSVGVILYEMLSGTPPFASDDPVKLVRMQVSKDPPALPDDVAPPLAAITMRLLAKDRDERFQSATEAREALELVLPGVASTDVKSGRTIHGGASGPIFINAAISGPLSVHDPASRPFDPISGSFPPISPHDPASRPFDPISGPFPRITHDTSGSFAPSALPTLPPQAGALRRKAMDRRPLIIGGAIVLLAGIWAITSGGDDETEAKEGSAAAIAGHDDEGEGVAEGDDELPIIEDGPDAEQITEIDRLILGNKHDDAQKLLQPLLDEFPDNPQLAWRQGKILAERKKKKDKGKALAAYGDAVGTDPTLLDNNEFYAELYALLEEPKLRAEALDLALRKMGHYGHKFLLKAINDDKRPMNYNDRQRAIAELSSNPDNEVLINLQLHRALDLLQATQALTPCTAYRDALEVIAAEPEYYYLTRVQHADMPKPKTGDELTDEERSDAAKCEGLEARRDEVIALLESFAPEGETDGDEIIILDDDPPADTKATKKKPPPKSGGTTGGDKGPPCLGIFRKCK
ncbi:MAG: serine/threonine protein kinase [Myxococcales bacterium]|nr:serine/threonine protein kinase [Myxococcales bacterium]